MNKKYEINWGGHTLSLEPDKFLTQATGAVLVKYDDTAVLCTVTCGKDVEEDFFPLTVKYQEKFYASGMIPGGYVKREGRSSDRETLISRLIDRPLRPLFNENFKKDTQIICTVLNYDENCPADIISIIGASAALAISGIPVSSVIAAARVGYKDKKFILNPSHDLENLDLVVAGSKTGLLMVESQAKELSEEEMLSALEFAHKSFQSVIELIETFAQDFKKPLIEVTNPTTNPLIEKYFKSKDIISEISQSYSHAKKHDRKTALEKILNKIIEEINSQIADIQLNCSNETVKSLQEKLSSLAIKKSDITKYFDTLCYNFLRNKILVENKRIDNRKLTDIRDISTEISIFNRIHGSAIFTRGETQAFATVTLGSTQDEQVSDIMGHVYYEHFILHYNFPPFSVGETGKLGAPGRREIGHGRLALRALTPLMPLKDEFPYTIRVVSEIMSCNGSSSMATVCASSMALMDAGVPLQKPVAGIAMGLIWKNENEFAVLSDIMGEEDHLGDMDFKVAGSNDGITALQMDIKIEKVTFEIMKKALFQAKIGREFILNEMNKTIATANKELSPCAPRMQSFYVNRDKIREIIGPGGKMIKEIIEASGAKIDIEDNGLVKVMASDSKSLHKAVSMIESIACDPEPGVIYEGPIVKIMPFGMFVNFFGGMDGMVHISEISKQRVECIDDIYKVGDIVSVKFLGFDSGKARLSIKQA